MISNHFSGRVVTFSRRTFFSVLSTCRSNVLQTLIHPRNFSNVHEFAGVSLQDCVSLCQHLGNIKELKHGKSLHSICVKTGLDQDVFVQNNMIRFYSVCGDLVNARLVFDEILEPNLVSWTSMISSYVHDCEYELGLHMFSRMCLSGLRPNEFGYSVALKACKIMHDFIMGMLIHGQIVKCGFESYIFCSASILGMYVEYGDTEDARKFFDGIPLRGRCEASWNALLDSYVQNYNVDEAVELFREMRNSIIPNGFTYTVLIKLCATTLNLNLGMLFHSQIVKVGFENDVIVGGALVDIYAKFGLLDDAYKVFRNLEEKDNVIWCALLAGFHQIGDDEMGLNFYREFLSKGNKPDPFTYASVISLCSTLEIGTQVHCSFIKYGFMMDCFLGTALIDMYGGIGMISDAYNCFLLVECKNEICFSTMINNLVLNSYGETALELLYDMRKVGLEPSYSTISYILRACANLCMLKEGRSLHSRIIKNVGTSIYNLGIENALIEMYAKCGVVDDAKKVFQEMQRQNEFSWTNIIAGNNEMGQFDEALGLFRDMLRSSGSVKPSQFTLVVAVQACTKLQALDLGKEVHGYVIKQGFESHSFIGSALINLYALFKHEFRNAFLVFTSKEEQDLVTWSTMITACSQNSYNEEALKLFAEFRLATTFLVDESVLSSCLSACAGLAALEMGKWFHACAIKTGFVSHLHVASSIIDMYSKCGNIEASRNIFNEMEDQNLVSWTAMVTGYAHNGLGEKVIELFDEMKETGLEPDSVIFVGVLSACSHAGLVQEGWQYFESIKRDYGLDVTINHYACMVDLLGRAEQVDEAEALIRKAPFDSKSLLWKTLLGACNKHGDIELGNRIAQMLIELEPNEPSTYVLLSNIYASASMWENYTAARKKMKEENVNKQPGSSWIHVAG